MASDTMRAMVIDRFGGPETLRLADLPVPAVEPGEVLVRVETAGVGQWDPFEREGGYAEMIGIMPEFPYVLGSDGSGVVAAVGDGVDRLHEGDRVHAAGFLNPKGGFYAEYVAVDADLAFPIPDRLTSEQAGVTPGVALTALRGLDDVLDVRPDESVVVVGAGGGVGHVAVQLAKQMGARVLAVASGRDGVRLAERLGADAAVDGHGGDVLATTREFAPDGVDAVLLTAGGPVADQVLSGVRDGGRAAYPTGVQPEPAPRSGVTVQAYNGEPDPDILRRVQDRIETGPFEVHVARTFPFEQAAEAHRALATHYLGKLALRVT